MSIEGSARVDHGRKLRLGMVGGGQGAFIGAVHRIAARLDDQFELVAGCLASEPARARASAADLGLPPERAYDDFETMARAEAGRPDGIDVVAIVTPNHVHFAAAKAFLEAGIHVICDKPLTTALADAEALAALVHARNKAFVLTHNYTGYPLVRQARAMVAAGTLGRIRVVQVEYPQDWLATPLEATGQKQAAWRTDPDRAGPVGCLGDIGTHAFNLVRFVTGLRVAQVFAELTTFVEGRRLDDDAQLLLRLEGGAKGALWSSQVATGNENGLRLRLYGESGGLAWSQEDPNVLWFSPLGEPPRRLTRGGPGLDAAARSVTRLPPGHPEGYLEGFANLYADAARLIRAIDAGRLPPPESAWLPTVDDGVEAIRFVEAALASQRGGTWTAV